MTPSSVPRVEVLEWRALGPDAQAAVQRLEISAQQVEFAGTTSRSVAASEAGDPAEVAGLAIRLEHDIVGWVVLKRGAAAPDWVERDAAVVSGLRIDVRHQGRGIGSAALVEMARWVARRWPGTRRLTLRVDEGNTSGIRAYEKAGWVEVGERRQGRVGLERTMIVALGPDT
ncbi:MAG: GNAT family N-acetyltransferase [Betaproteobacteria bacterium]